MKGGVFPTEEMNKLIQHAIDDDVELIVRMCARPHHLLVLCKDDGFMLKAGLFHEVEINEYASDH